MAEFRVEVNTRKLQALIQTLPGKLDDAVAREAFEAERMIKESFGTSPPGRVYPRRNRDHTASLPGHPPNVDLGNLRSSIQTEKIGQFEYKVSDGVEYGAALEIGTDRIQPRPFMRPAVERIRQTFLHDLDIF